jgi:hypothetical protein
MSKKKHKLDQFHYHEAVERAYIVGYMGELFLIGHPVCKKHKKIRKKVRKALQLLAEVYQEIGYLEFKKFD